MTMNRVMTGVAAAVAGLVSMIASAVNVYVDGRNGNDNWDGSCAYADRDEAAKKGPLKTFSKFKDKYNQIDDVTVYIAPDTYYWRHRSPTGGRPG